MNFLFIFFALLISSLTADDLKDERVDNLSGVLSRHQPIYFAMGKPNTKVQISMKYKVFGQSFPLYLAYSQFMFWDIFSSSSPFRDINYNPEIFYRLPITKNKHLSSIDFGFYEHKSNGKPGVDSRAYDSSYIRFNLKFIFEKFNLRWNVKLFALYNLDSTNRNIGEYSGVWHSQLAVTDFLKETFKVSEIYFNLFCGGKTSFDIYKGGQEIGIILNPNLTEFNPGIIIQIYNGHNESQLDYNKKYTAYRFGLIF